MGSNETVYATMPVHLLTSQFNTTNNTMKTCFTSDEGETVKHVVGLKILWQQSSEKLAHFVEVNNVTRQHGDNQQAFTIFFEVKRDR
jgi:hypothetical protein